MPDGPAAAPLRTERTFLQNNSPTRMAAQALQWHSLTNGPEGLEAFERDWSTVLTLPNSQEQRQRPQEPGDLRTTRPSARALPPSAPYSGCCPVWVCVMLAPSKQPQHERTPRSHPTTTATNRKRTNQCVPATSSLTLCRLWVLPTTSLEITSAFSKHAPRATHGLEDLTHRTD